MKPNKKLSAVLAGALAVGAVVGLSATSAQAYGPTSISLPGSLFLSNTASATNATTNNTYTDTLTMTQSPTNPNAGDTVTVTLSGANGFTTGPVPVSANTSVLRATVTLAGAQSGDVQLGYSAAACNYPASAIGTYSNEGPWTTSGTYVASGNGAATLALKQIFSDDQGNLDGSASNLCSGSGSNADYYVSDVTQTSGSAQAGIAKTAPAASSTVKNSFTITGPNASVTAVSGQSVTTAVRLGNIGAPTYANASVTLTGTVWGASVASGGFTAQYCDSTGTTCDAATTNTLSTDASGVLSGTVNAGTGASSLTGNRAIKLTQGTNTSLTSILVLGTSAISLSPSSGGPGTVVSIAGSNFNPSKTVTAYGASTGIPTFTTTTDAAVSLGTAGSTGAISGTFTVNASTTINLVAYQGIPGSPNVTNPAAYAAFTVNLDTCTADTGNVNTGNCNTKQNIYATVLAGTLSQTAAVSAGNPNDTTVVFCKTAAPTTPPGGTSPGIGDTTACGLTSPTSATAMYATLNPVTVTDARGGTFGWSLTATLPNLSDGTHSIQNSAVAITPACASVNAASAPGAVAGAAAQTFSGTVSLCVKDTQISAAPLSQTTGGQWTVSAPLTLTVPSFQAAGTYTSTMTINLA